MTLRARLLLVLVGVVAAGLVISDVVVYAQLRSFLVERIESELRAASYEAPHLLACQGVSEASPAAPFGCPRGTHLRLPRGVGRPPGGAGLFPTGTVAELVRPDGSVRAKQAFYYGGRAPAPPALPHPLPKGVAGGPAYFTARSAGPSPVRYEVLAQPLPGEGVSVVVAIPLTDVDQTLGRLALVMLLVSVAVLAGLGVLAWWIVRRGLRPLEDMAAAAGTIAAGDLARRVAPADDRTEVGRLGLSLNAMLAEIEAAFAARTASEQRLRRFLADASHELRTPLTSIRGYAEIFDLGARERPEDLATAMHRIREEADRMHVLVDDLLLLARLDHERPLEASPTDLVPVVARAVAAVRAAAPGHPVTLAAPPSAEILGDAGRLRQVVDNLLVNAVRHSPPGEPVTVVVARAGGDVVVEVADRGPGVPPAYAHRIFEPFYRADASRARATGGTGLGLAIVAAIARAHGGTVGVRANGEQGARFWVRLPAGPADQKKWIRDGGQSTATTSPTMVDFETKPQ